MAGTGSIGCLNIWVGSLSDEEMFESAGCETRGNIYSLTQTIKNNGITGEVLKHPDSSLTNGK